MVDRWNVVKELRLYAPARASFAEWSRLVDYGPRGFAVLAFWRTRRAIAAREQQDTLNQHMLDALAYGFSVLRVRS